MLLCPAGLFASTNKNYVPEPTSFHILMMGSWGVGWAGATFNYDNFMSYKDTCKPAHLCVLCLISTFNFC